MRNNDCNRHSQMASRPSILLHFVVFVLGTTLLLLLTTTQSSSGSSSMSLRRDWTPSQKGQRWLMSSNSVSAAAHVEIQQRVQEFKEQQQQQQQFLFNHQEDNNNDNRNLISWGSAICELVPDIFLFRRDDSTGMYVLLNNTKNETEEVDNPFEYSPCRNKPDTAQQGKFHKTGAQTTTEEDPSDNENTVRVRVCWCTDFFSARPLEFCPAEFNTCAVPPDYDLPVACYQTNTGDVFVRSFWPVALFWMIALLYACFCSESGRHARKFVRRNCILCNGSCCNPHERRTIETDLNELLELEPERTAYMYRRYVYLQRQQQHRIEQRQQRAWYQWWQALRPGRRSTEHNNNTHETTDAPVLHVQGELVPDHRPRLELKTKVFRCHAGEDDDADPTTDTEGGGANANGPTTAENNNNDNSESNAGNGGWSLPQLHLPTFSSFNGLNARESTTLEEMDGEMEQGERCAICLLRLEDGDVVGDLPCNHILHKDCLKDWLKRKNRCPLCQQTGIARFFDGNNNAIVSTIGTAHPAGQVNEQQRTGETLGSTSSDANPGEPHEQQQQQTGGTVDVSSNV